MIGFPSRSNDKISCALTPSEARRIVMLALADLGWAPVEPEQGVFKASTSINLLSFGEKVTIDTRAHGVIDIESRCAMPTQVYDWGKNKANIGKFRACFDKFENEHQRNLPARTTEFEASNHSRLDNIFSEKE